MFSRATIKIIKNLILLSVLLVNESIILSTKAMASGKAKEEAKHEKPEGEGEPKGEEGKPEGEGKAEPKRDSFAEVQGRVATLQSKIRAGQETIEKLIEEKQHAKSSEEVGEIIKNMVNEHKAIQKNIADYDKARSLLKYRFPEKGLKGERKYERIELKSLDEIETEIGIDARVKKTLRKIRKQYQAPDDVAGKNSHGDSSDQKEKVKAHEQPSISDPVILTK